MVVAAVIEWRWAAGKSIVRSWSVAGKGAALLMVWMLLITTVVVAIAR